MKFTFFIMMALLLVISDAYGSQDWQMRKAVVTKKVTLKNGLEVFLTKNPKAPLVSVYHWVRAGSLHEKPGTTGIAHLFEHMMFRPVGEENANFFDKIQSLGGTANANTRYMATVYTTSVPERNLAPLMEIEANRFQNLKVNDQLLDVERKAVWSEYSTKFDTSPVIDIWGKIYESAFPGHPYEWTIIGYREDLNKIKAKDANDFFNDFYKPNNIGLFISGDIDIDDTLDLVKRHYSDWKPGKEAKLPKAYEKETKLKVRTGRIASKSRQILAGFRLPNEDRYAFEYRFLDHVLFSSSNSLATKRLKQELNFVSTVSGFNYDYDSGLMKIFMVSLLKDWKPLLPHILRLDEDFQKMSDQEFQAYKTEFLVAFKEGILRNSSYNEELALSWGKLNNVSFFFEFENHLNRLNKESLSKLLDSFYKKDNLVIVKSKT